MRKFYLFTLPLTLYSLFLNTSCNKEDEKPKEPIISIYPGSLYVYGKAGDIFSFKMDIYAEALLNHIYITAQPENGLQETVLDTIINTTIKEFSVLYQYKIPQDGVGKSVIFTFNAYDTKGEKGTDVRKLIIQADTTVLTETAGHEMYSGKSKQADAFDLETNSPQFSILADSTLRDIQDYPASSDSTLSLTWISPAGGKFVRFNGFDYANATVASTVNAYESGTKLDLITDLKEGDVIITKLASISQPKYVVIKITDIHDNAGKEEDYYRFNIKKRT